ncbi:MAG: PAS domain S-box protein [Magnetospirillum sp.]|nr:PAS domain S-box protein [Magnetospirillum sp.]
MTDGDGAIPSPPPAAFAGRPNDADLRAILDNMADVFFRTDCHGRLVMVSRSVETLLGWAPAEMLGNLARQYYVDVDQRQAFVDLVDRHGGRLSGYDLQLRRRNGSTVWVSASARRLAETEGGGLEGILHDVSDRRRAERQQDERRGLVQALLNATSDATMLIDASGSLLACNKVFADRFGKSVEQVVGGDLFALFPPDVAASRRAACAQAVIENRTMVLKDERNDRHFHNTITPVPNSDGVPMVAVFSRDITEELADKARIEAYVATIRQSNEELEQFAYVASHDLREPLRQISSYIGLLERRYGRQLDADAREFMAFARNGAQRMDALILDLLAFSRVTRDEGAMVEIPLSEPVAAALLVLDPPPGGALDAQVDPSLVVKGDAGQLTRLFQNLIGNALKYRSPHRPPQVRVTAAADGPLVRVDVADNGIGIEPQYYERIFRIFQRLHGIGSYDGTGIGLAIVKRVAENHGGSVSVASIPGEGSTFTVTLPLVG